MLHVYLQGDCYANTYDAVIGGNLRASGPTINAAEENLTRYLAQLGYKGKINFHRPKVEVSLGSEQTRTIQL